MLGFWGELWRGAGRPARALFIALALLFSFRAVYTGKPHDLAGFLRIGGGVLDGAVYRDALTNTYPPPFSVAMAPLSALARVTSERLVRQLWGLAQLGALAAATAAFVRALRLRATLGAVALAWLCLWRFVVGDLNNQNVTLFLLALCAWALERLAAGAIGSGGAALAVGASLKVWPGFALPALVAARGWRAAVRLALGALAGGALAVAVTCAAFGPARALEALRFWIEEVVPKAGGTALLNQSWKALVLRAAEALAGGPAPAAVSAFATIAGWGTFAAICGGFAIRPARDARGVALDGALGLLAGMIVLPFTWFHYYLVALPVVLAVTAGRDQLEREPRRIATALLVAGAIVGCLFDIDLVGRGLWQRAAFFSNAFVGAMLMLAAGLVVRRDWRARASLASTVDAAGKS